MKEVTLTVLFLLWVNFLPALSSQIFGPRFTTPLDLGRPWTDGEPIFGPHKTIRGVLTALAGSLLFMPIFQLEWSVIVIAAYLVVAGDVFTSFIKRRMHLKSGATAIGFDQFLECFLPTLYLYSYLHLSLWQALLAISIFIPLSFIGSKSWLYLTYRPTTKNSLRIIRSAARLRAWRACHIPLVRWQVLLNFEHFLYYRILMTTFFKATGLYEKGMSNAMNLEKVEETFYFPDLPPSFDGFTILFLADLHLDGMDQITDRLIDQIKDLEVDLCLLGGDYRMELYGSIATSLRCLRRLRPYIHSKHGVLGVLGNHDCIEMLPDLEDAGIIMLVNDSWYIEQGEKKIWIVGIDDPHYYKVHDLDTAFRNVPSEGWKIFLSHSPEVYKSVAPYKPHLYFCGHTHGGQICLPGNIPVFTHCKAPRTTAAGRWEYKGMKGYTTRGVGTSGVPVRFFCSGEVSLITLRRGNGTD